MFKVVGRKIDRELNYLGLHRKDFRINFWFRGRRWFIETFNPLWWAIRIGSVVMFLWVCIYGIRVALECFPYWMR